MILIIGRMTENENSVRKVVEWSAVSAQEIKGLSRLVGTAQLDATLGVVEIHLECQLVSLLSDSSPSFVSSRF